jgi:DNA-binding NarL/FixJ family response regulator
MKKLLTVAILQSDSRTVRSLASSLCHHFHAIHAARSMEELREAIAKHRPEVAILDVEMVPLSEIERLHREFTGVCIVATHRLADEEMWTAALAAGAADVCSSRDTPSIVNSALRYAPSLAQRAAA